MTTMRSLLLWAALAASCSGAKLNLRRGGRHEEQQEPQQRKLVGASCLVLLETTQFEDHSEASHVWCQLQDTPDVAAASSLGGGATIASSEGSTTLGSPMLQVDALNEEWVSNHGVVSGETTLEAPGAVIVGNTLQIGNPSDLVLHNTLGGGPMRDASDLPESDENDSHNVFEHHLNRQLLEERRRLRVVGERTVLVVRVIARDTQTSSSASRLSNEIFGTSGDNFNLKSQMESCSFGQLSFVPANDSNRINNGVITVRINSNARGVDKNVVRENVVSQLERDLNTNKLDSRYDHVMLCLPRGTGKGESWLAYAFVGWYQSVYNDDWCLYPSANMHEIGHNLGLSHSGQGNNQYADRSGMMGFSYSQDDGPVQCFNAVKSWELGWYRGGQRVINPLNQRNWRGNFVGISEFAQTLGFLSIGLTAILKLEGDRDFDYYINFNRKSGRNSGTQGGANKVLVVRRKPGLSYATSYLMASLDPGQTYSTRFGGRTLRVQFQKMEYGLANVKAIVQIST